MRLLTGNTGMVRRPVRIRWAGGAILTTLAVGLATSTASAEILLSESFSTYTAGNLVGQALAPAGYAPGQTWLSDIFPPDQPWWTHDLTIDPAADLTWSSGSFTLPTAPGKVRLAGGVGLNDNARAFLDTTPTGKFATASLLDAGSGKIGGGAVAGTLYYRWLVQAENPAATNNGYSGLELVRDNNIIFSVGDTWGSLNYSTFGVGGDANLLNGSGQPLPIDTNVHLVVVKITFKANTADELQVWLDPDPAFSESSQPASVYTRSTTGDLAFDSYMLREGSLGEYPWNFDQIRFATTWSDLFNVPEVLAVLLLEPVTLAVADVDADQPLQVFVPDTCPRPLNVSVTSDHPEIATPAGTGGSVMLTFGAEEKSKSFNVDFVSAGTATFTATETGCGLAPVSATITVHGVQSAELQSPHRLMLVGQAQQALVTGSYGAAGNRTITGQVTYTTLPEGVVTVDAAGMITAVGLGAVTVTASRDGVVSNELPIQVIIPPDLPYHVAGSGLLLVDLDAADPTAGTASWTHQGSLRGQFEAYDLESDSIPTAGEVAGVKAVTFDGSNGYLGPYAPPELLGASPRTIEVWVLNPTVEYGETLVGLGRRNVGAEALVAYRYGLDSWGALSTWGSDFGWSALPATEVWHHLVLTYDPTNTDNGMLALYSDGTTSVEESPVVGPLNTTTGRVMIAVHSKLNNQPFEYEAGSLSMAAIRIHDGVLSAEEVAENHRLGPDGHGLFKGDYDLDGDVDLDDLALFIACSNGPGVAVSAMPAKCPLTDVDGDGDADQTDFGVWQRCYTGAGMPADPACH